MAAAPHADLALARHLEACEGETNGAFVETHAQRDPTSGASTFRVDGVLAMYDGAGSPLTQTFGLGVLGPGDDATLDAIEAFFGSYGVETQHEVSPLAGVELAARLVARGYVPVEYGNVLVRALDAEDRAPPTHATLTTREVGADAVDAWVEASVAGWSDEPELAAFLRTIARTTFATPGTSSVGVFDGDALVATGSLALHGGTALLAGASTLPSHRGRGAQTLLLGARLALAAGRGAERAMIVTLPGSTSQRNAERHGFRVAYTRAKWSRAARPR